MQTKIRSIILCALAAGLAFWACDDTIDNVGMGIQPDQDKMSVYTDTFDLSASTIRVDSIYAKTIYGYLGRLYDPLYGEIESGYICQFYGPASGEFSFAKNDTIINNRIDSVFLVISYQTSIGDTLAPMEVSAFPVVNPLEKNYYTNMNPAKYCDLSTVLGKKGYTARNLNIEDSIYNADYAGNNRKVVAIRLPREFGQKLYDEFRKPVPNAYSSLDDFVKFFPGIYVKSTFGSGNMLSISLTDIYAYYQTIKTTTSSTGKDSTYVTKDHALFNVTKEVIQLNSFKNTNDDQLLIPSDDRTYVKTPSGLFTKITIPIPEIKKRVGTRKFSNAGLSLSTYAQPDWKFPLSIPSKMLLINPDSVTTFFENQKVADKVTTYTCDYNNYTYNFNNIASVIQNAIDNKPDQNLELLVIPVQTGQTLVNNQPVEYLTQHYLAPSAVTIKKDKEHLRLKVITTNLDINQKK